MDYDSRRGPGADHANLGIERHRRRDAAHELGHIVLHAKVPQDTLTKPEQFKKIEKQAHRFAAAFLIFHHQGASPWEAAAAATCAAARSVGAEGWLGVPDRGELKEALAVYHRERDELTSRPGLILP